MEALTDVQLMEKHRTFRLNTGKKNIALFHLDFHPIETQTFGKSGNLVTE